MARRWHRALWGALLFAASLATVSVATTLAADDTTPPGVARFEPTTPSPVSGTSIEYALEFDEPVGDLSAADFTVGGTSAGWSVASIAGSDHAYVVSLAAPSVVSGSVVLSLAAASVVDAAGNAGPPSSAAAAAVDVVSSTAVASIVINQGAATTSNPTLELTLAAESLGKNRRMRFSLDGGKTWTELEPFAATRALALPAKWRWGQTTVTVEVRDGGGATASASDSIAYIRAERSTMWLAPSYLLEATLDYGAAQLTTRQTVDVTNRSEAPIGWLDFSVLARHYGELAISWVEIDGGRVEVGYPNSASMRVPLGYNLRPGESARVTMRFVATAKASTSDHLRSRLAKANGLMQVSSWHPVLSNGHGLSHPGDSQYTVAADYRLELTHPTGVVIAAPGRLVDRSPTRKVYTLSNAREFAFGASPGFVRSEVTTSGGVVVEVYNLPGTSGAKSARNVSARALELHAARLGPYPYERYLVVQGARASSALEYSGVVFIGHLNFGYKLMLAHEAAHQWWYSIVGNDQLAEPWLDEAFAEFTSRRLFGYSMPTTCSTRMVDLSIAEFSPTATGCGSYAQTIYGRGARFLDGVRARLGTAAFFDALRMIVREHRFGVVNTAAVRATFLSFASDRKALNAYMNGFLVTR